MSVSVFVVALLVLAFFREPGALLALLPLAAAIPFTFAAVVLAGMSFTPTGIGLVAIIVGIGIDDAVHILVRVRRGLRDCVEGKLAGSAGGGS